jgi:hypothetical protein
LSIPPSTPIVGLHCTASGWIVQRRRATLMVKCSHHGRKNKKYSGYYWTIVYLVLCGAFVRGILVRTVYEQFLVRVPGPWAVGLLARRLLAHNLHSLEYDPHVQYRFHQSFMFLWLICMVGIWFMPLFHEMTARLIMEVSLYSNFATDFGAMSSALAAGNYHCKGCRCGDPPGVDW